MPVLQSPSSRLLSVASDTDPQTPRPRAGRAKRYGSKFASGFLEFYKLGWMADCTVLGPDGKEYRLHGLLLAYHSEFFRRALSSDFKEGQEKRIELHFEDAGEVWPCLIEYFYTEEILLTDSNVLALLAASRELLIPAIQEFCGDFAQSSLEASNAIQFLSQAVQYNCDQIRGSCVTLVAQSFNTCCFKATDGLPVEVMLEILEHPQLYVQTEEQVLLFVLNYVRRHQLDEATIRALFAAVRLPYLSNDRLSALALEGRQEARAAAVATTTGAAAASAGGGSSVVPPADMLLTAMAQRLYMMDHPDRLPPATGGGGGGSGGSAPGGAAAGGGSGGVLSPLGDGRSSPAAGPSSSSLASGEAGSAGGGGAAAAWSYSEVSRSAAGGAASGSGNSGSGSSSGRAPGTLAAMAGVGVLVPPRKSYCCTMEYGLPGGSEYVSMPMEQVWEDLAANLTVRVSGDTVEGDPDSILRTLDDSASWFTVTSDDPCRPVWVEVTFPPHMRVVELTKYTFSHGMNMIAHMFPYGISDSAWFQMKGMSTQVSPGGDDDASFTALRTADSCSQHTEFVVTVDSACSRQVVWRRLRITAGEDSGHQVRLSIRKLKLFGRVEVSLMREPEGRDVVAAWRVRKEAAANPGARNFNTLRGMSARRLDHF